MKEQKTMAEPTIVADRKEEAVMLSLVVQAMLKLLQQQVKIIRELQRYADTIGGASHEYNWTCREKTVAVFNSYGYNLFIS